MVRASEIIQVEGRTVEDPIGETWPKSRFLVRPFLLQSASKVPSATTKAAALLPVGKG